MHQDLTQSSVYPKTNVREKSIKMMITSSEAIAVESSSSPVSTVSAASELRTAILIPCYNEELTIHKVVVDFRLQMPEALIYVFDNNSRDRTAERARAAGAILRHEPRQGKGFVVQQMFHDINADVYVMVDGDDTYAAEDIHKLIAPILNGSADMVVGSRLSTTSDSQFRLLNRFGNNLFLFVINKLFKVKLTDVLSGYRAFNQRFVKGIPLFGGGFETETELTLKALARGFRVVELPINLRARPTGSESKIRVIQDGYIILNTIFALFRDYKPLTFFGATGIVTLLSGIAAVTIGRVIGMDALSGLAFALCGMACVLFGVLLVMVGMILHTITRRFQELEHQLSMRGLSGAE